MVPFCSANSTDISPQPGGNIPVPVGGDFRPGDGEAVPPCFVYGKRIRRSRAEIYPCPSAEIFVPAMAKPCRHTLCMASGFDAAGAEIYPCPSVEIFVPAMAKPCRHTLCMASGSAAAGAEIYPCPSAEIFVPAMAKPCRHTLCMASGFDAAGAEIYPTGVTSTWRRALIPSPSPFSTQAAAPCAPASSVQSGTWCCPDPPAALR